MQAVEREESPIVWGLVALIALLGANVFTFYDHYVGSYTFPWDFLGGYHSQAFAWYADGSFFQPPRWFPWADMGFPVYWALQSGAFYLPLAALDLVGIPYTLKVATTLQAVHVLAGGVGMYVLLRALRFEPVIALLGALAYHYSSSFYSNAQHVDIVRAAALLPWLLWALLPQVVMRSWLSALLASLVLFQFFVAAYPGTIVSAAYAVPLCVSVSALPYLRQRKARSLIAVYVLIGVSAASMAMLKWLPPIFEGDLAANQIGGALVPMTATLVPTVVLPFDRPFLPGDPTMRSLWLPTGLLVGLVFLRRMPPRAVQALTLVATAVLLGGIGPSLMEGGFPLPGLRVSRFPVADWRPVLHIGLIILACEGWRTTVQDQLILRSVCVRSLVAVAVAVGLGWVAIVQGYEWADLIWPAVAALAAATMTIALTVVASRQAPARAAASTVLIVALGGIVVLHGDRFYKDEARVWRFDLKPGIEEALFGGFRTERLKGDRAPLALPNRPARLLLGKDFAEMLEFQNLPVHNKCFYTGTFCVLGYNNLRLSLPHLTFRRAAMSPQQGPALLNFVRQPQKLIVLPAGAKPDFSTSVLGGAGGKVETAIPGVAAEILGYGGDWTRYKITVPREVQVIENEIWTSGWTIRLCQEGQCRPATSPEHTEQYLRTWIVPAGTWDVVLRFRVQSERYTWISFYLGLLLSFLAGWLVLRSGDCRNPGVMRTA